MIPTTEQKIAIDYSQSMVIIAKPGSGKTFVISEKIRNILPSLPDYKGVIAISYTNKASDELKKRISKNGCSIKSSCLSTIDSFCLSEIIYPFLPHLWGIPQVPYEIIDKKNQFKGRDNITVIDSAPTKNDIVLNEFFLKDYFVQKGYILVEFIGALALYVLHNSIACRKYIKSRYTHVFVDEYQDADQNQHEIFLTLQELGLIAVAVGDASQSIFGFAGKKADFLLSLPNHSAFANFVISYNHRSHPSISNYANALISKNPILLECDKMFVYEKRCIGDEASICEWIDKSLPQIMECFQCDSLSKIGILTPTNKISHQIGAMLKTPSKVFSAHPLEEQQSLTANLLSRLLYFYFDHSITLEEFIDSHYGECDRTLRVETRKILREFRKVDSAELISQTLKIAETLATFSIIEREFEILKNDCYDNIKEFFSPFSSEQINIMTSHKSKGLEFDIVFISHLYEWIVPNGNEMTDQAKNLHYVSITRGKKACFLCHSTQRHRQKDNNVISATPSLFLQEPTLISYRKKLKDFSTKSS